MTSSALFEFLLVVVGGQPADDEPVVFSEALAVELDVFGDRAAELLVDREVAQEFVGGGAVELGVVDELLSEVRVGAQVVEGERGLGGGGVDAAGDEVPEDVEQLFVGEALAVEFELDEEAGQVVFRVAASFGRELDDFLHHGRDLGDGVDVFGAVLGHGHDGVEEVGVELPVVEGQAHQLHGQDGRDRAGVVEHEVHLPAGDFLVEEVVGLLLHERLHLLDGAGGEERGQRVPQGQVVFAVDLADAQGRLAFGAWDAHLALVVDAVFGVGFVSVGEGVVVSCAFG